MKKRLCLLLAAGLLAGLLSGCGQGREEPGFRADNEIITYQPVDPEKTQIVVSRTGNIAVEQLCQAFEEVNSDIQVIYLDITGGNADYAPLPDWLKAGAAPDVMVSAMGFLDPQLSMEYVENLSDDPIIQRYENAALQRTAVDANVYWLPGPSNIVAMMYNKTLFERYGWELPTSFEDFVSLCDRIREDTDGEVEAWNPNAKYSNELMTAIEAICYEEMLGGLENRQWYNELIQGKATVSQHMEPYFRVLQTLIDHGILREEHFSYSATARGKEFDQGKIAMVNGDVFQPVSESYQFGVMPFPSTEGELGYLCDRYSCYGSLPKKEHSQAKSDALHRFLEFFSSEEGQEAYIGNALKLSNVKGVELNRSGELAELQEAVDQGHLFGLLDFKGERGYGFDLHGLSQAMAAGTMTAEECMAEADRALSASAEEPEKEPPALLATAAKDLSMLETSFLMADMYREAADADIGLIAHNEAYRGNLMRIFAGDLTEDMVTVFKPRSFANDAALVRLAMTGEQIIAALNAPIGNNETADCVYAYAGLKCTVAPWDPPGSKYLAVTLADGSELDPERLYTVAAWDGTVAEEFISETPEPIEGTWEELFSAKLRAMGSIVPAEDGRIKLVWD